MTDIPSFFLMILIIAVIVAVLFRPLLPELSRQLSRVIGCFLGFVFVAFMTILFFSFFLPTVVDALNGKPNLPELHINRRDLPRIPYPPAIEHESHDGLLFANPVEPYDPGSYQCRDVGIGYPVNNMLLLHLGEDVALDPGTPVFAVADGTVVLSARFREAGMVVGVEHELSSFNGIVVVSFYSHLADRAGFEPVELGEYVQEGDLVGYIGWDNNWKLTSWRQVDPRRYKTDRYENDPENGEGLPHLHLALRVVGRERDYRPGVPSNTYKEFGYQDDILTRDEFDSITHDASRYVGKYMAFSEFKRLFNR